MSGLRWHWRNCRSIGLKLDIWLWPWAIGAHRHDDVYGGEMCLFLGPVSIGLAYSIGNASSVGPDRFTALDESTAVNRAARYEEKPNV